MERRSFGPLGQVSALALGGGGIAGIWGATDRAEAVATAREAVDSGIALIDVAPTYGAGEAERVVGEAFQGRLPEGVRISTKVACGSAGAGTDYPPGWAVEGFPSTEELESGIERSLASSRSRLRIDHIDILLLHVLINPDDAAEGFIGVTRGTFTEFIRPLFERLLKDGQIGAWGITGIGVPTVLMSVLEEEPAPAVIQCIANLFDSPGEMKSFEEPARPRDLIEEASARGVGVMGIRAVQAGALTDAIDRDVPDDHPIAVEFRRAAPLRALAKEAGEPTASLAHRYALSIPGVSTVVLGVKNRTELRECIAAEARGPLEPELIARIDRSVAGG